MIQQIIASIVKAISLKVNTSFANVSANFVKLSIKIEEVKMSLITLMESTTNQLKESDQSIISKVNENKSASEKLIADLSRKIESANVFDDRIKKLEVIVAADDKTLDTIREIADRIKDDSNTVKMFRESTNKSINYIMPEQLRALSESDWDKLVSKLVEDNWSKS